MGFSLSAGQRQPGRTLPPQRVAGVAGLADKPIRLSAYRDRRMHAVIFNVYSKILTCTLIFRKKLIWKLTFRPGAAFCGKKLPQKGQKQAVFRGKNGCKPIDTRVSSYQNNSKNQSSPPPAQGETVPTTFRLPSAAGRNTTPCEDAGYTPVSAVMLTWCVTTTSVPGPRQRERSARA